jgi:nitrate/nitrite transporter NarK
MLLCFSNYLVMWITSFVQSGIVRDDEEAKEIYARVALMTVGWGIIVVPLSGWFSDKISPHVAIPVLFAGRAVIINMFLYDLEDPTGIQALMICSLMMVFTMVANILVNFLFLRNIPAEIRGAMNGVYAFVSLGF